MLSALVLFSSCKKSDTLTSDDQEVVEDNAYAEQISDDVIKITDDAYYNNSGANSNILVRDNSGSSAILADTVKITKTTSPDTTISIDFGTNGILCKDLRIRKGIITFKFSNGYKTPGSVVTQTFTNYVVSDRSISNTSTRSITYVGLVSGKPTWNITANLTITKPNGTTHTWNSTRTRTMIAGSSTPFNWLDDQYEISGTASGVTGNGSSYSMNITKNLLIVIGCRFIQDGAITMTRGTTSYSIDYSVTNGGSCDDQATFIMNGKSYQFTLK
jgi:hypothetical protein